MRRRGVLDSAGNSAMSEPTHPLRGLLIAQFLGAFNDNAWKLIVALLGIRAVAAQVGPSGPAFEVASQAQATLAFVVFTLPLMVVSIPAGVLADRLSKRTVIITMKAFEILGLPASSSRPSRHWDSLPPGPCHTCARRGWKGVWRPRPGSPGQPCGPTASSDWR